MSGGLISDLRMFMSVNRLIDRVTKLRRCSGIIKTTAGVVYGHRERDNSTLEVLDQVDESSEGGYQVIGHKSLRSRVGRSEFSVENSQNREDRKIARSCKVVSGWRKSPP